MNGFGDREPVLPPIHVADGVAGLYGASAAMIALREVEVNGGRGQVRTTLPARARVGGRPG